MAFLAGDAELAVAHALPHPSRLVLHELETGRVAAVALGFRDAAERQLLGPARPAIQRAVDHEPLIDPEAADQPVPRRNRPAYRRGNKVVADPDLVALVPLASEHLGHLVSLVFGRVVLVEKREVEPVTLSERDAGRGDAQLLSVLVPDSDVPPLDGAVVEVSHDDLRRGPALHLGVPCLAPFVVLLGVARLARLRTDKLGVAEEFLSRFDSRRFPRRRQRLYRRPRRLRGGERRKPHAARQCCNRQPTQRPAPLAHHGPPPRVVPCLARSCRPARGFPCVLCAGR